MTQGERLRRWLVLLAAVSAVAVAAPVSDGPSAGATVALGAIKGAAGGTQWHALI